MSVVSSFADDHGDWTYTTFIATAQSSFAEAISRETAAVAWVPAEKVDLSGYALHPGFAPSWRAGLRVRVDQLLRNELALEGWRCFSLDDANVLQPPFLRRYWPDRAVPGDAYSKRHAFARCLATGHLAPVAGCTCGLRATVDLTALLEAVSGRSFAGSDRSILDECGVLAHVRLSATVLEGVNMPVDDPLTTWRGGASVLLDVHLAPWLADKADAVAERYGVPVAVYELDEWPGAVKSLTPYRDATVVIEDVDAFRAAVVRLGFGASDGTDPTFVKVGRDVCDHLRRGGSLSDVMRVLFDQGLQPTHVQVRGFVDAAITHLGPDCKAAANTPTFVAAVSPMESVVRMMSDSMRRGGVIG